MADRLPPIPYAAKSLVGTYQPWTETTTQPDETMGVKDHDAVLVVGARHALNVDGKPLDPDHFEAVQFMMQRNDGTARWSLPMAFPEVRRDDSPTGWLDAIRRVRLDQVAGGENLSVLDAVNHAINTTHPLTLDMDAPNAKAYLMLHQLTGAPFTKLSEMTRSIQRAARGETKPLPGELDKPILTEAQVREVWVATHEGPNYTPSFTELLERVTLVSNIARYHEEECGE